MRVTALRLDSTAASVQTLLDQSENDVLFLTRMEEMQFFVRALQGDDAVSVTADAVLSADVATDTNGEGVERASLEDVSVRLE